MPPKVKQEELLADIQRVAVELGHPPLVSEYEVRGRFSPITARHFGNGTWRSVIELAGLQPTSEHRRLWTNQELLDELDRLRGKLGHNPTFTDIKLHSIVSPDTFHRRLGNVAFNDPRKPPVSADWDLNTISDLDGAWIAGLICGEGSFIVNRGVVEFRVGLRADDRDLLEFVKDTLDLPQAIGQYSNAKRRERGELAGDEVRLSVSNRWVNKLRVIPFFDHFQLRGRKALDFAIFKEAVLFLCERDNQGKFRRRLEPSELEYLAELTDRIRSLRRDPSCT